MKEIIRIFLMIGISTLLQFIDWHLEGKLSKLKPFPFLFEKFLHLNLLSIALIIGIIWLFLYLYKRFISPKRKLRTILKKAEKFNSIYENYINFLSNIYEKRYNFSVGEERKYLTYHNKLRTLFLDIKSPLVKFLEEEYVVGRIRTFTYRVLGGIEHCFMSPNLREHFLANQEKPERDSYYKPVIEQFVSYLRSII